MNKNHTIKLGVAPTRRGISSNRKGAFTLEAAMVAKNEILEAIYYLKDDDVEIVTIEWLTWDRGLVVYN